MKSREVYNDCCYAKDELEIAIANGDYQKAKILWFSCLTLLRSIGHVLNNVDVVNYGAHFKLLSETRFNSSIKKEPIFEKFIKEERDKILKEYSSSLEVDECKAKRAIMTPNGLQLMTPSGQLLCTTTTIKSLIKTKSYAAGENPILVLDKALNFWDKELSWLEEKIERLK